jgi:hypothetical protein
MKTRTTDSMLDRRAFVRGSMLALLGGATVTIVGCGDASLTAPTAVPQAAPPVPSDVVGNIASNHGHVAMITGAQLTAQGGLSLSIRGTSSHDHIVELSASEVSDVRRLARVSKLSSGTSHTHMVVFNEESAPTSSSEK